MQHLRTRYALQRADGLWFHNPTSIATEWSADCSTAHLWVDFQACVDAAYIRGQLRSEDVQVRELLITCDGQRLQLQGVR